MKQDLDAIVIGAGPYGLASAAFLRRANAEIRVFGEPMGFWRDRMPAGMILRSQRRSSHIAYPDSTLSLDSWADAHGEDRANPVPLDQFLPYALWYAEQAVPDVDRRRIESVESVDGS